MKSEKKKNDTFYKTDSQGVLEKIRAQVEQLIVPNFNGLRILLLERQGHLRDRDNDLSRKQEEIASEGMAAAFRLMMPDDEGEDRPAQSPTAWPYYRLLPAPENEEE